MKQVRNKRAGKLTEKVVKWMNFSFMNLMPVTKYSMYCKVLAGNRPF